MHVVSNTSLNLKKTLILILKQCILSNFKLSLDSLSQKLTALIKLRRKNKGEIIMLRSWDFSSNVKIWYFSLYFFTEFLSEIWRNLAQMIEDMSEGIRFFWLSK